MKFALHGGKEPFCCSLALGSHGNVPDGITKANLPHPIFSGQSLYCYTIVVSYPETFLGPQPVQKKYNMIVVLLTGKGTCIQRWIWCSYKKTGKKGHFFQQSMYARTLKRASKTAKFGKKMCFSTLEIVICVKGVLHPWALFLKVLCIFSRNKATSDKVSYGSGQKCSKKLKNHSFTLVETIVVKLQWKMGKNQYFPCFEP